jgi:hypothetical protein
MFSQGRTSSNPLIRGYAFGGWGMVSGPLEEQDLRTGRCGRIKLGGDVRNKCHFRGRLPQNARNFPVARPNLHYVWPI